MAALVGLSMACGSAAQARATHVSFVFSGSAFELSDSYADTAATGVALVDRLTQEIEWGSSCNDSIATDVAIPGSGFTCSPSDNFVAGSIDDENPTNPTFNCNGRLAFRTGSQTYIGGTLIRYAGRTALQVSASAPVTSRNVVATPTGNPLNDLCSAPGFEAAAPDGYGVLGQILDWPANEDALGGWTWNPTIGATNMHVEFSAQVAVTTWTTSSPLERDLAALGDTAGRFYNGLLNGVNSLITPRIVLPVSGTLTGTGSTSGSGPAQNGARAHAATATVLFKIHQHLRAGAATALALRLTPKGRALLTGAQSGPRLRTVLTFTPNRGRRVTARSTLDTQLVPEITSVTFTGPASDPTVVVHGRALAPLPAPDPAGTPAGHNGCPTQSGDDGADYGGEVNLNDISKHWAAGIYLPALNDTSCIGIIPTKVSPGEVDFKLGSFYTDLYPQFALSPGDEVQVVVNGAALDLPVSYG